jgi:hypothetical protein
MGREWQRGDVAFIPGVGRALMTGCGWLSQGMRSPAHAVEAYLDPRPLVVIDPEDREQVERLGGGTGHVNVNWLQDRLRAFADPKPEEPTGLGAVVECDDGATFVRVGLTIANPWVRAGFGTYHRWSEIDATACVLSEGVQS